MSHMAPGEGSPNDNAAAVPEQPYEPQQGTGDAERPQEEVQAEQEQVPPGAVDAAPRTDVTGRALLPGEEPQADPAPEEGDAAAE